MRNKIILITGCQRSGTTLLHLILNSHPQVHSIDEMHFDKQRMVEYINSSDFAPSVSFKLPVASHALKFIETLPDCRILWCVRDPRDVVASMIRLQLQYSENTKLAWAAHPNGVIREIRQAVEVLQGRLPGELADLVPRYQKNLKCTPLDWSQNDMALAGAFCWRLKQAMPALYEARDFATHIVNYEALTRHPEQELRQIMNFLDLAWDDRLLEHHTVHSGTSVGGTVNDRPVDTASIRRWPELLTAEDQDIIHTVCGQTAREYGYEF